RQVQMWPRWACGSRGQRIKLWSGVSTGPRISLWPLAGIMMVILSGQYQMSPPRQRSSSMMSNALFMAVYPVFFVIGAPWPQRKLAAFELLRPVGRSQFLIERGLLYACRLPAVWLQFSIAWIMPACAFASDTPGWVQQMFSLLMLSAVCQVLLFGLTAWVMPS